MRKLHWSVWGFVGFFSMMLLGLWVDSRWLLGVGAKVHPPTTTAVAPLTQVRAIVPAPHDVSEPDGTEPLQSETTIGAPARRVTVGLSAPGVLGAGLDIPETPSLELLPSPETASVAAAIDEPLDMTDISFTRLPIPVGPIQISTPTSDVGTVGDSNGAATLPAPRTLKRAEHPAQPLKEPANVDDDALGSLGMLRELQEKHSTLLRSPAFAPDAESKAEILRTGAQVWRQQQAADREAALADPPPPPRSPHDFASAPPPPEQASFASPPLTSAEQVDALRAAAQQMDDIANQLERQSLYSRADQVRGVAQELRLDARRGAPRPPAPGPTQ